MMFRRTMILALAALAIPILRWAVAAPRGAQPAVPYCVVDTGQRSIFSDEGQLLKGRYRVIKISLDKVLMEDTQQKQQQSLKIEPEITG